MPDTIKRKIKALMVLNDDTQHDLARKTGISYTTLSNKLNGKCKWSREDIASVVNAYHLSSVEMEDIFFS